IGNEGNGLTKEAIAGCDVPLTIPMLGRAESLNASVAASIIMWELCRPQEN
ncbi:MAG: RNA methyltransferase, partial [Clostridia bacterium]|nr:RNA methyltransferase [Clostridia bacterium]